MANHNIAMSLTESPATQSFHTVWPGKDFVVFEILRTVSWTCGPVI